MANAFKKVGVIGRQRVEHIDETLSMLIATLQAQKQAFVVDDELKDLVKEKVEFLARDQFAQVCDLFIVVGGDGSLLQVAKMAADHDIPMVGINKGRLGFLTDILPQDINSQLREILQGSYQEEERLLVEASIQHQNQVTYTYSALNDVVLLPGRVAHMIEFEISINNQFVLSQRSDGLIVATPTGSTAYALSGGGPILHPGLEAMVLVPMFPHTLSVRPIVVRSNSKIDVKVSKHNETSMWVSCDGQEKVEIFPGDNLHIQKKDKYLRLLHPMSYQYYETLRTKLHWG